MPGIAPSAPVFPAKALFAPSYCRLQWFSNEKPPVRPRGSSTAQETGEQSKVKRPAKNQQVDDHERTGPEAQSVSGDASAKTQKNSMSSHSEGKATATGTQGAAAQSPEGQSQRGAAAAQRTESTAQASAERQQDADDNSEEVILLRHRLKELEEKLQAATEAKTKLESEVADLHAAVGDWKAAAIRERADLENARRIAREDVAAAKVYAIEKFAKDLLILPDTVDTAIELAEKNGLRNIPEAVPFVDGMKTLQRSMLSALSRNKIVPQEVEPMATTFNPNLHDAVAMIPHDDAHHEAVVQVVQPGWLLGDRVMRAAKVLVAENPSKPAPKSEKPDDKAETKAAE